VSFLLLIVVVIVYSNSNDDNNKSLVKTGLFDRHIYLLLRAET